MILNTIKSISVEWCIDKKEIKEWMKGDDLSLYSKVERVRKAKEVRQILCSSK